MNKLERMRNAYENGDCKKQYYIEEIHQLHANLFDYPSFLKGTDVESIKITDHGIYVRSRSQKIDLYLDAVDEHLVPYAMMNFFNYEAQEIEFLKSVVQDNWTILDIGANCGWYSLSLAKKFKGVTVHAFEPIKKTYEILLHNINHNSLDNIHAHQIGLSDKNGVIEFLYTPTCSGATSIKLAGQPPKTHSEVQKISCQTAKLDSFCKSMNISPDLIKCDVEGAELMVIQGGIEKISTSRPVILIELLRKWAKKFDYHPNAVIESLKNIGYTAFTLEGNMLNSCPEITESTQETNFVFLHNEKHSDIINRKISKVSKNEKNN